MFTAKEEHFAYAESLGLKTIAIYTGLIIETSFWSMFGNIDLSPDWCFMKL